MIQLKGLGTFLYKVKWSDTNGAESSGIETGEVVQ
jgi:hypothetical protein